MGAGAPTHRSPCGRCLRPDTPSSCARTGARSSYLARDRDIGFHSTGTCPLISWSMFRRTAWSRGLSIVRTDTRPRRPPMRRISTRSSPRPPAIFLPFRRAGLWGVKRVFRWPLYSMTPRRGIPPRPSVISGFRRSARSVLPTERARSRVLRSCSSRVGFSTSVRMMTSVAGAPACDNRIVVFPRATRIRWRAVDVCRTTTPRAAGMSASAHGARKWTRDGRSCRRLSRRWSHAYLWRCW